ncbi:hypothetical protein [Pseudomonas aeruginosa]|uniref:hypothetical protein n=1 Tax=Pseudomonas aeruginosa TaxID=287 RepID=UPI003D0624DC
MNLVALAIMLGAIPPVCLKGSKLLTITFNASALAANITGNVYDRFNRLSGSVLHDQYLLRRLRKGPSKSLKVVSLRYERIKNAVGGWEWSSQHKIEAGVVNAIIALGLS